MTKSTGYWPEKGLPGRRRKPDRFPVQFLGGGGKLNGSALLKRKKNRVSNTSGRVDARCRRLGKKNQRVKKKTKGTAPRAKELIKRKRGGGEKRKKKPNREAVGAGDEGVLGGTTIKKGGIGRKKSPRRTFRRVKKVKRKVPGRRRGRAGSKKNLWSSMGKADHFGNGSHAVKKLLDSKNRKKSV